IAGQETIIRAPEGATLMELHAVPGSSIARGSLLARMGNIDLEEQWTEIEAELARARADHDRLLGELRVQEENAVHARLNARQRQRDYGEIDAEQRQINERRTAETRIGERLLTSLDPSLAMPIAAITYPPAVAMLAADMEVHRSRLQQANDELGRARELFSEGLLARRDFDAAETRASTTR